MGLKAGRPVYETFKTGQSGVCRVTCGSFSSLRVLTYLVKQVMFGCTLISLHIDPNPTCQPILLTLHPTTFFHISTLRLGPEEDGPILHARTFKVKWPGTIWVFLFSNGLGCKFLQYNRNSHIRITCNS